MLVKVGKSKTNYRVKLVENGSFRLETADGEHLASFQIEPEKYQENAVVDFYYNFYNNCIEEHDVTNFIWDRTDYRTTKRLNFGFYTKLCTFIKDERMFDTLIAFTCQFIETDEENPAALTYDGSDYHILSVAASYFPAMQDKLAKLVARKELLNQLDPNNSLSYIEAQLDMLTKLVITMLKSQPEVCEKVCQSFIDMPQFEQAFNETSVLSVKTAEKCLEELWSTKAKVRDLQRQYFEAKNSG